jgi:hypothetical protein
LVQWQGLLSVVTAEGHNSGVGSGPTADRFSGPRSVRPFLQGLDYMLQSRSDVGPICNLVDDIESFVQQNNRAFQFGARRWIGLLHGCRHRFVFPQVINTVAPRGERIVCS